MKKLLWYLKQLLPLIYYSVYRVDGKKMFCIWRMWLGKSYHIEEFEIK